MNPFEIVKATMKDLSQLQDISCQTFFETYAALNTAENIAKYLDEKFATAKLSSELKNPDTFFYFAKLKNECIGYLKLNIGSAQTELQDDAALEIERIYVLKAFQGQKIGQLFCDQAILTAQMKDKKYIWLGVWEENPKAIQFYKKNGFLEFDKHVFKLGDEEQIDIMMRLELGG